MTQLLVSVKSVQEALLALEGGADIVDLKDPAIGALGALSVAETVRIMDALNEQAVISATVGERHDSLNSLLNAVTQRAQLGVDIIKVAIDDKYQQAELKTIVQQAGSSQLMAVLFADEPQKNDMLSTLSSVGFCGVMLDTRDKSKNLLQYCNQARLQSFSRACRQYQLQFAFAGSLRPLDIEIFTETNATYLGFRGGLCQNNQRTQALSLDLIQSAKNMLRAHNKMAENPHKS